MKKIYIQVIGVDHFLLVPLISAMAQGIFETVALERKEKLEFEVVGVLRSSKDLNAKRSPILKPLLYAWMKALHSNARVFEGFNSFELACTRGLRQSISAKEAVKNDCHWRIVTDVPFACDEREYVLFEDPEEVHDIVRESGYSFKESFVRDISDDLCRKITIEFDEIINRNSLPSESQQSQKSKDSDGQKSIPNKEQPIKAPMGSFLAEMDLNYDPDFEVFEEASKTAIFELFGDKEENDWNVFLLGCFLTGFQARLPEVRTMWELRKQILPQPGLTKSGD